MTGDPNLAKEDRFMIKTKKKKPKAGNADLLFLDDNKHWQSLNNKRTAEFLAPDTLRNIYLVDHHLLRLKD